MKSNFKPVYIPIALTGILIIAAIGTGLWSSIELMGGSLDAYTLSFGTIMVFFLIVLPLSLFFTLLTGFAYLGIAVGIWVFYGLTVLLIKFVKKHFIINEYNDAPEPQDRYDDPRERTDEI